MDDSFRLGVNFTARFMRLYSEFYKSDVLIASPLGLRLAIEEHSTGFENHFSCNSRIEFILVDGDVDFLSSLEMVVLDQAEYHLMQNFDHVSFIFERLNLLPKQYRDTDITRVRMLNLNEQSMLYR